MHSTTGHTVLELCGLAIQQLYLSSKIKTPTYCVISLTLHTIFITMNVVVKELNLSHLIKAYKMRSLLIPLNPMGRQALECRLKPTVTADVMFGMTWLGTLFL